MHPLSYTESWDFSGTLRPRSFPCSLTDSIPWVAYLGHGSLLSQAPETYRVQVASLLKHLLLNLQLFHQDTTLSLCQETRLCPFQQSPQTKALVKVVAKHQVVVAVLHRIRTMPTHTQKKYAYDFPNCLARTQVLQVVI